QAAAEAAATETERRQAEAEQAFAEAEERRAATEAALAETRLQIEQMNASRSALEEESASLTPPPAEQVSDEVQGGEPAEREPTETVPAAASQSPRWSTAQIDAALSRAPGLGTGRQRAELRRNLAGGACPPEALRSAY